MWHPRDEDDIAPIAAARKGDPEQIYLITFQVQEPSLVKLVEKGKHREWRVWQTESKLKENKKQFGWRPQL